jgi:hypothetical protein
VANYRLFGEVLETRPFRDIRATLTEDPSTLTYLVVEEPPSADWSSATELYSTPPRASRTDPDFRFFRLSDRDVIRVGVSADFHLLDDQIICHLKQPDREFLIEIVLSGLAFAFWLERRGVPTLHGSAVSIDGAGVGFLAVGGMGKSSLASFLTAGGDPLITEDLLVVRWRDEVPEVQPGLAQLRLWPDQAARFVTDWESLDQPHPGFSKRRLPIGADGIGTFADNPVPLRRLYVLERLVAEEGEASVLPLPGGSSMEALLRNSYLPEMGEKFRWQARRLGQLSELLAAVPVRVLRYPTGVQNLAAARAAIVSDLGC